MKTGKKNPEYKMFAGNFMNLTNDDQNSPLKTLLRAKEMNISAFIAQFRPAPLRLLRLLT